MMKGYFNHTNVDQRQHQSLKEEEEEEMPMTMGIEEGAKTTLSSIAEAFEELERCCFNTKEGDTKFGELKLDSFCKACALTSVLFSCLGLAFKFAESEYVAKVRDLVEASKSLESLRDVVDEDVARGTVRSPGSHTRNLRRVRQGLGLIRALFLQFLATDDYSLRDAATTAYAEVCAPYHTWAVRTAVYAGMYTLPSRDQLLLRLNETEHSAETKMLRYVKASLPIIQYIDRLYMSRDISLDW